LRAQPFPAARLLAAFFAAALLAAAPALAHFGMVIPSAPTVMESSASDISLEIKFWHPFENKGMDLAKPKALTVFFGGASQDALPSLVEARQDGFLAWTLPWKASRPGLTAFLMEPQPYWEPEEDKFIIHYTKAYVDAFGDDEGWWEPVGAKTEIVPRVRPGALYAGNVFTGVVLLDGQPVPGAEVEVELYPGPGLTGQAPYASMVTQVVLADESGAFHFAPTAPGWWGFAALSEAGYKLSQDGEDKDVELGAVLWLYFHQPRPASGQVRPASEPGQ
jgi:cobalt/nickel transport protein